MILWSKWTDYGGGMTIQSRPMPEESVYKQRLDTGRSLTQVKPGLKERVAGLEKKEKKKHESIMEGLWEGRGGGQGGGIYEGGSDGWTGVWVGGGRGRRTAAAGAGRWPPQGSQGFPRPARSQAKAARGPGSDRGAARFASNFVVMAGGPADPVKTSRARMLA